MKITSDIIETKRLIIKPLTCDELKKYIHSPGDLAKELGLIPSQTLIDQETRDAITNDLLPNLEDPNKDPLFYTMWIVIGKSEQAIVGGICFHGELDEMGEVEIGYGTDEAYRNRGIMTEAIAGMIQWISKNKKVKIIKAETDPENISSVRVLEKNNFITDQQNDHSAILRLAIQVK
jgi:RimJ/RimL family protein N-acetyltransferase